MHMSLCLADPLPEVLQCEWPHANVFRYFSHLSSVICRSSSKTISFSQLMCVHRNPPRNALYSLRLFYPSTQSVPIKYTPIRMCSNTTGSHTGALKCRCVSHRYFQYISTQEFFVQVLFLSQVSRADAFPKQMYSIPERLTQVFVIMQVCSIQLFSTQVCFHSAILQTDVIQCIGALLTHPCRCLLYRFAPMQVWATRVLFHYGLTIWVSPRQECLIHRRLSIPCPHPGAILQTRPQWRWEVPLTPARSSPFSCPPITGLGSRYRCALSAAPPSLGSALSSRLRCTSRKCPSLPGE